MKSRLSPDSLNGFVEALESRIAPARIFVGAPNNISDGRDLDYQEQNPADNLFVHIASSSGDAIADAMGGSDADPNTYYLRLNAGDELWVYAGGNSYEEYLVVTKGSVIAFFVDKPGEGANEVQRGEITGIALGNGANIRLSGEIAGDIVSNFDVANNRIDTTGLVSSQQGIAGVKVSASVHGSIISGGTIGRVEVSGDVQSILTGTAADGYTIDFLPGVAGGDLTLSVTQPAGKVGPSIKNVIVDSVADRIEAGAGGLGAAGGSLLSIRVSEDTDGFTLKAGNGGAAVTDNSKGGAGGSIKGLYIASLQDPTNNDLVQILAGSGGDSLAGAGGKGGSVSQAYVGYELVAGKIVKSSISLQDTFVIAGGAGGDGKIGGKGGEVFNLTAHISTPNINGDEFTVRGGAGGDNVWASGGAAGAGGSIRNVAISALHPFPDGDIVLEAGDGGAALTLAKGGAGGSIDGVRLVGADFRIEAGDGSTGKTGGLGGSVKRIAIQAGDNGNLVHNVNVNAGRGGDGTAGNGGNGGQIQNFQVELGDLSQILVNATHPDGSGTQADGGNSIGGRGGKGGSVTDFRVTDIDASGSNDFNGPFTLRGGAGGNGDKGGGDGGSLTRIAYGGFGMSVNFGAGNGGNATVSGNGGAGGKVTSASVTAEGTVAGVDVSGILSAGAGGHAAGVGAGGRGGDVRLSSLRADGLVELTAGDGGSGTTKAAGSGGSVIGSGAYGIKGSGLMRAGDAGEGGALPGNGGSIAGLSKVKLAGLFAAGQLTVEAGDGTHGGSGGSIRNFGYGSAVTTIAATPIGDILIKAGDGSAEGSRAGAGGSLVYLFGTASSPASGNTPPIYTTTIAAGHGGGGEGATKTGAGGSITGLSIDGGGYKDSVLTIAAGDGGSSSEAATGGKGGSVTGVAVADIHAETIFRSVAAGDGGAGSKVGGKGGSVTNLQVKDHDIGVRMGAIYGYNTMGGIFAGAGGTGDKAGLAGDVTNVTAQAIASIVAGKGAAPQLVEKVDRITVGNYTSGANGIVTNLLDGNDLNMAEVDPENDVDPQYHAFILTSYQAGHLVGAVVTPDRPNANRFLWNDTPANPEDEASEEGVGKYELGEVPIDGLIAAKNLVRKNLNFVPEAYFNGIDLEDHNNVFTTLP